jgi:L-asparaginase II
MAEGKQLRKDAKVDGEWVKCGNCGAKIMKVTAIYDTKSPNAELEHKCKVKHNGKTCNCYNRIVI